MSEEVIKYISLKKDLIEKIKDWKSKYRKFQHDLSELKKCYQQHLSESDVRITDK